MPLFEAFILGKFKCEFKKLHFDITNVQPGMQLCENVLDWPNITVRLAEYYVFVIPVV